MDTVGVTLIGSGYIARYHARGLWELPDVKLRALCSLDGEEAGRFAEEYGITEVTDRIDDLTERTDIHGVIICTPNKFHAPYAIDTVRYLLGDPAPKEVYAKISTRFGNYDVDDTSVVMITWDAGAVSIIEGGWWHPHADGPEAATQIFGTLGYASLFPT